MSLAVGLAKLLEALEPGATKGYVEPFRIERTHAGRHQRSAGAWSWVLLDKTGHEIVGSCFRAREILRPGEGRCVKLYRNERGFTPELIITGTTEKERT